MKKRLLLDMSMLKYYYTGLGQFSYYLGQSLFAMNPVPFDYHILVFPDKKDYFPDHTITTHTMSVMRRIAAKRHLPFMAQTFDLWHILSQNSHYFPFHTKKPIVFTIHDVHGIMTETGERRENIKKILQKKIDSSTRITVISELVKHDIESHFTLQGKTIDIIYNGVEYKEFPDTKPPHYCEGNMPFFFTLGTITRRKNIHVLIDMMVHLPQHRLIIGGTIADKDYYNEMKTKIEHYGLAERIVFTDTLSDEEKYYCYTHCQAVVFPSLMEGFGMPIIEAYRAGKPIFCSALTSLPEIGGSLAEYWHSFEPQSMATILLQGLSANAGNTEAAIERQRYAEQFSWSKAAAAYLRLYQELT